MLYKMRNAGIARFFKARAAFYPDAERGGAQMRHDFRRNDQAIPHFPLPDIHISSAK
jgi:hypothetical protein